MITIDSKEDIELLLLFFEQFNLKQAINNTEDSPSLETSNIEQRISVLEQRMMTAEDVKNIIRAETTEAENETETGDRGESEYKTIRKYTKRIHSQVPKVKSMTDEGYFILGKNHTSKWNIEDLLKLKKCIPQKNVKYSDMCEKVDISEFTVRILCCAIETGLFDKYFDEWEQKQANNFYKKYGDWKPAVENNPQKRKEAGMC